MIKGRSTIPNLGLSTLCADIRPHQKMGIGMPTPPDWTLEWFRVAQGFLGTLTGGGLVLLGGWLADSRKNSAENLTRNLREKALLTGMFAVRNYVAERLNEWGEDGILSKLEPLRTAQVYVHRLIDKAPGESESLMITVIEIGLNLDALIATIDRRGTDPGLNTSLALAKMLTRQAAGLEASLNQFDIVAGRELFVLSEEEMMQFPGYAESHDKVS
jgi:hypothetical protein